QAAHLRQYRPYPRRHPAQRRGYNRHRLPRGLQDGGREVRWLSLQRQRELRAGESPVQREPGDGQAGGLGLPRGGRRQDLHQRGLRGPQGHPIREPRGGGRDPAAPLPILGLCSLSLDSLFRLPVSYDGNPFYAGEEEDREQGRAVIREEVAPEYRVVRERPLGREDEEVSQEPDAQDAEHERDL